jgi:uncharacterized membrane protein (UPF0127 family)
MVLLAAGVAHAACDPGRAEFRWQDGKARFAVEIADDEAERERGLMFRDKLPSSAGMLFVYDRPQQVAFWMKNTLIPLDMIFIDDTGRVNAVHANAVPGDLTPIPGPADTLMVLEIGGGLAARLGLAVGAEFRHPQLDQSHAVWPCNQP